MVIGIIGNSLVLTAVSRFKSLQTVANAFIVNLAIADLLVCFDLVPYFISIFAEYSPSMDTMCTFVLIFAHSSIGCSIFTLASIAVNRFVLISSPRKYYRIIFRRKIVIVWIGLLWITAIVISVVPPFVFNIGKLTYDPIHHWCRSPANYKTSELYDKVLIYGFIPVPLAITIVCYVGIFLRLFLHNQAMQKHSRQSPESLTERYFTFWRFISTPNGLVFNRRDNESYRRNISITKNMFYVLCAYLICCFPLTICSQVYRVCPIDRLARHIVSFNSAIIPIIYGVNHPQFRQAYIKMLKCETTS
ncbi:Rhodopsin, GQ-coupled [Holothuria leucospilota]|uniref:Rhodopsin, GQ-coupled n=1 Tax=Holothuria leucospilota TaxID=206669 RepID=A0A9Q1H5H8_HOLLE|nr:Rhodopsin, GQ-coupled [Holothuria leucospilota]